MRITTAGRYAVRSMLDLALHDGPNPVLRQDISDRQQISAEYIAQLFRLLAQDGLVKSVLGPGGGYHLGQQAESIRIGDIIRCVEGPFAAVACLDPNLKEACCRESTCVTRTLWIKLSQVIEEFLDGVTLTELCKPSQDNNPSGLHVLDSLDELPQSCTPSP